MSRICRNKKRPSTGISGLQEPLFLSLIYMTAGQVRRWLVMDQVFIEEAVRQIGNLGFPALIAMYLLTRFEKKFDALIELMTELKEQKMKN